MPSPTLRAGRSCAGIGGLGSYASRDPLDRRLGCGPGACPSPGQSESRTPGAGPRLAWSHQTLSLFLCAAGPGVSRRRGAARRRGNSLPPYLGPSAPENSGPRHQGTSRALRAEFGRAVYFFPGKPPLRNCRGSTATWRRSSGGAMSDLVEITRAPGGMAFTKADMAWRTALSEAAGSASQVARLRVRQIRPATSALPALAVHNRWREFTGGEHHGRQQARASPAQVHR